MSDIKQRIETAKTNHRKAEQQKTVLETQHEAAIKQRDQLIEDMKEAGVTPETIQQELARLEVQIEGDLQRVESLLPKV